MREAIVYHRPLPHTAHPGAWRDRYEHRFVHFEAASMRCAALSAGVVLGDDDSVDVCMRCGVYRLTYRGRVMFFAPDRRPMKTSEPACIRHGRW